MHLADHIRPLLRDHDCVIIPDFGGLVADASSARAQPGRQALSPPTKLVAFNQSLTRNDGLLVDALSQHMGFTISQAREAVRTAVAALQRELDETNRTELPGIGIFRRAAGRGLAFEYTGTDNLLTSSFGLPELAARPVRNNDSRVPRPQPALRGAATRRPRWARLLPGTALAIAAALLLLANYQVALNSGYLPASWRNQLPKWELAQRPIVPATSIIEPQQANLGQHSFDSPSIESEGMTPLVAADSMPVPVLALQPNATNEAVAADKPAAFAPSPKASVGVPAAKPVKIVAPIVVVPKAPVVTVTSALDKTPMVSSTASITTIKTRTGRFYVIAGAYSSLKRAEEGRKNLAHSGHASHVILPPYGSRLFRLTAADYPDLASAQREAQRLRVNTHCDYNTLKF